MVDVFTALLWLIGYYVEKWHLYINEQIYSNHLERLFCLTKNKIFSQLRELSVFNPVKVN